MRALLVISAIILFCGFSNAQSSNYDYTVDELINSTINSLVASDSILYYFYGGFSPGYYANNGIYSIDEHANKSRLWPLFYTDIGYEILSHDEDDFELYLYYFVDYDIGGNTSQKIVKRTSPVDTIFSVDYSEPITEKSVVSTEVINDSLYLLDKDHNVFLSDINLNELASGMAPVGDNSLINIANRAYVLSDNLLYRLDLQGNQISLEQVRSFDMIPNHLFHFTDSIYASIYADSLTMYRVDDHTSINGFLLETDDLDEIQVDEGKIYLRKANALYVYDSLGRLETYTIPLEDAIIETIVLDDLLYVQSRYTIDNVSFPSLARYRLDDLTRASTIDLSLDEVSIINTDLEITNSPSLYKYSFTADVTLTNNGQEKVEFAQFHAYYFLITSFFRLEVNRQLEVNLEPGQTGTFNFSFNLSSTWPLGDITNQKAIISSGDRKKDRNIIDNIVDLPRIRVLTTTKDEAIIELKIAPNPSQNRVQINSAIATSYQLYNTAGMLVKQDKVLLKSRTLDLSDIDSGLYKLLLMDKAGHYYTDTIVKQ